MRALVMLVGLGLTWIVPGSALANLKEPETGATFEQRVDVDGTTYECLGTGVRKVLWIKAYAVAYCLGERSVKPVVDDWVRKTYGELSGKALVAALEKSGPFYERLARQPADRLVVMKMTRDVSRDKLASSFRDSLSDVLPADSVQKLVDAIPSDAKKGDVVHIWAKGATVTLDIAGQKKVIEDENIAQGLWNVWLSGKSVTPELRKSLAKTAAQRASAEGNTAE